jgi:hypothetical protein
MALATSGCFSNTWRVITLTISSQELADSFWSQFPPSARHVIDFMEPTPKAGTVDIPQQHDVAGTEFETIGKAGIRRRTVTHPDGAGTNPPKGGL